MAFPFPYVVLFQFILLFQWLPVLDRVTSIQITKSVSGEAGGKARLGHHGYEAPC